MATDFTNADMYEIISNTIQSAISYIVLCSENDISPNLLDYQGMKMQKNAMISELAEEIHKLEKENEGETKEADKKAAKAPRARIKRSDAVAINANVAEKYLSEAEKEEA